MLSIWHTCWHPQTSLPCSILWPPAVPQWYASKIRGHKPPSSGLFCTPGIKKALADEQLNVLLVPMDLAKSHVPQLEPLGFLQATLDELFTGGLPTCGGPFVTVLSSFGHQLDGARVPLSGICLCDHVSQLPHWRGVRG